jgi:hypothetical protein
MRRKLLLSHDPQVGTRREINMIDGRFDQHFLEIFAREQCDTEAERKFPWDTFVAALVALAVFGAGAIFLIS